MRKQHSALTLGQTEIYRNRLITVATKARSVDSSAGMQKARSEVPAKNSRICSIVSSLDSFISITIGS